MAAELKVDFITEMKADPTYEGIDVAREFGKMEAWCRVYKKVATKRRFVNWLNRVDAPVMKGQIYINPAPDNEHGLSLQEAIKLRDELIEVDAESFQYMIRLIESDYGLSVRGDREGVEVQRKELQG